MLVGSRHLAVGRVVVSQLAGLLAAATLRRTEFRRPSQAQFAKLRDQARLDSRFLLLLRLVLLHLIEPSAGVRGAMEPAIRCMPSR
jgi:hypothetical protein